MRWAVDTLGFAPRGQRRGDLHAAAFAHITIPNPKMARHNGIRTVEIIVDSTAVASLEVAPLESRAKRRIIPGIPSPAD
jgi:hypothetical protein